MAVDAELLPDPLREEVGGDDAHAGHKHAQMSRRPPQVEQVVGDVLSVLGDLDGGHLLIPVLPEGGAAGGPRLGHLQGAGDHGVLEVDVVHLLLVRDLAPDALVDVDGRGVERGSHSRLQVRIEGAVLLALAAPPRPGCRRPGCACGS